MIEGFDAGSPGHGLKPDVLIVTGDHSTPRRYEPQLAPRAGVAGRDTCRPDGVTEFGEASACAAGWGSSRRST